MCVSVGSANHVRFVRLVRVGGRHVGIERHRAYEQGGAATALRGRRRRGGGVLVASGLAVVAGRTAEASPAAGDAGSWGAQHQVRDVSANLFEWNWPSVANECTTVLGPAGYGGVQVSPPQDSLSRDQQLGDGSDTILHPWWEVYQPVDYKLTSRMGNEAQFKAMVATCRKAGVKVYRRRGDQPHDRAGRHVLRRRRTTPSTATRACTARANFHHTAPVRPTARRRQRQHRRLQQPAAGLQLRAASAWPTCAPTPTTVRGTLAGYLNKLIGYGVSGFRVDAAKHIGQADLAAIDARLHRTADGTRPFVGARGRSPAAPAAVAVGLHSRVGDVLGFDGANQIQNAFKSYTPPHDGNIADLKVFGEGSGLLPSNKTLVFVAEPRHRAQRLDA